MVEFVPPGFTVGKNIEKMGLRTAPMGKLILQDCFLPVENRLGPAGIGAAIFNSSMEWECACILGTQVGAMEWQLEELHNYSEQALCPSAASGGGVRGDHVDLYLEKSLPICGTHPSALMTCCFF